MSEKMKKIVYNVNKTFAFLTLFMFGIAICSSIIYHVFGIYPDTLRMIVTLSAFLCLGFIGSLMIMHGINEFIWYHEWFLPPAQITGLVLILISSFGILMFGFGVGLPLGIFIVLGWILLVSWVVMLIWFVCKCWRHF